MARFSVGQGFFADFDKTPLATANGELIVTDSHLILIKSELGYEHYIGDFTYSYAGLPLGTIHEYRLDVSGSTKYLIADAGIDVLELRKVAAELGDFLKLIFRSNDVLAGGDLADRMGGYGGDDILKGGADNDYLRGMPGNDIAKGGAGDDVLIGGRGKDDLRGGADNDWLDGGKAKNILTGGEGEDTFVFKALDRPNTVTDFAAGDRIALGFRHLGPNGPLDPGYFHVGAQAETHEQRVLYNDQTGWLAYASHGSATEHPEKFARIGAHLDQFDASDIAVI